MNAIADFANYEITEQLYAGTRTLVYRGIRTSDRHPVAIKTLRNEYPNFAEIVQFRNQYTIAKNLNCSSIIQPLTLEVYHHSYALVMEDFGGVSLSKYLKIATDEPQNKQSLPLIDFLDLAIQITDILHYLYQNRVIHKDIKPGNILIHPDTKQIKLIDFSISSLLPRETQEIQNPNVLEGTLAYLSPEQTGRMNRGIDYRSDFYSLGVTFYELLTGRLPFISDDPMELVHCHLAKQLIPIHQINPEIPLALSEIVSKLMAKNAEDRYQTALGIKHDLEICRVELQRKGSIPSFALATRDISDRFTIPEKLYGRETEVAELLDAFERVSTGSTEMMLVAGFSGIGKTAVINEVHKPIVRQRGYFIKGKYDQFQRNIPFSAFVQAFRDLMAQLLSETDARLQTWKTQILAAVGDNGQVLIDVIPELEHIIGKQPTATELTGSAAQNRFHLLFQNFVQVFTKKEHPLVMFLDDWQWADSASLNLLQLLMQGTEFLLVLGAYRDNEVSPAHPFIFTVDEIIKTGATVNKITLAPLSESDLNQLVADTLNSDLSLAEPLTKLVYQKTKGNPFFAIQFLKALHEDNLISFDWNIRHWQCDIARIKALVITDDVVEFMAIQLQKLPIATQEILKLAACIGNQFDLDTLSIVYQQSQAETASQLWKALQEGFVLPTSEVYKFFQESENNSDSHPFTNSQFQVPTYRFVHDRVQQAAYSLIPIADKEITHLNIGRLLLKNTPESERSEKIFEIVNQLNRGVNLLTDAAECQQLAELNLIAGGKAKASTAYLAALEYAAIARQLLPENSWQTQYNFTLDLYTTSVEVAYLSGDFESMERLGEIVLEETKGILDRIKVYEVKTQALLAQNKISEAVNVGLEILKLLGVEFPEKPSQSDIIAALQEIQSAVQGKEISDLINLPLMTDRTNLAAMQMMSSILGAAYLSSPELYALLTFKEVILSIQYGNTFISTHSYACYGLILCGVLGDLETGQKFGQLALDLLQKLNAKELECKVNSMVYGFIKHWKYPVKDSLVPLRLAYSTGLEIGDLQFAGYSAAMYCGYAYFAGIEKELSELSKEAYALGESIHKVKQMTAFSYLQMLQQALHDLQKGKAALHELTGEYYDEKTMLPVHLQANDRMGVFYVYCHKLLLEYLFENYQAAVENANLVEQYLDGGTGFPYIPIFYFYDSLSRLAAYRETKNGNLAELLARIETNQEKMKKWADFAPMNCQYKFNLVAAERHQILGENWEALENYDRAIEAAKENGYMRDEAIANELAAKFYLALGKEKVAHSYMQEAYYGYARWGAKAKLEDLERRYPQLLKPILQQRRLNANPLEKIATVTLSGNSLYTSTSATSSSNISDALDFAAVLKAAQAISSNIKLDDLMASLTRILLEISGAKKSALILLQDETWQVRAITSIIHQSKYQSNIQTILDFQPLDTCQDVPNAIIHYVKNTQKAVIIDRLKTEIPGLISNYMLTHQPQSVFCTPIVDRGHLIGILYLENKLTSGVFTSNRLQIINLLSAQAAISLENARLYQQAQQALTDLKQAQLQIVQSEKMSALGNLVAGVAHEINNPVGFLSGNIQPALDYIKDLFELIDLVQKKYPQLDPEIEEEMETIDLNYIREDLPKLVSSMREGVKRIKEISTSLRTFSRADSDRPVSCHIHDGIDSTLMILKHRLKANSTRPEIQVIKKYGDLPQVKCYAGQLNQVFMNLLSNAIDALEESDRGCKFAEITNQITIQTELSGDPKQVIIRIKDNGIGMSEAVQEKIFENLFTTKGVGKGTGLGLAIARQIVEEKHGGAIACCSELGKGTEFKLTLPMF